MSQSEQPGAPAAACHVGMSNGLPCGRPIYHAPGSADPDPPCILHSREATKDPVQFRQEIDAILTGTSAHHRHKDKLDFTGFVFPGVDFSGATFTRDARFFRATFTQTAGFRWTEFRQPELVRFYRVNQERDARGLRARFVNCRVEGVQFADVNWHRQGGRMVLQDELNLTDPAVPKTQRLSHELVAIAYRQLVNNFEKERAYDLAEECKIGAMEMKRFDSKNFLFANWLEAYYEKWRWLRWLGENVSAASLYRLTSHYGTSYTRALLVLLGLLVLFALLFALPWSAIQRDKPSLPPVLGVLHRLGAGLFHSLKVAAFQRDSLYGVPTRFGRLASILETIFVPAQLALFLLALRRRFRH